MKTKKGLLFVVSAPSGAGKTSLCKAVTNSLENLTHSTSYTTRKPRPGEAEGKDYYFVTPEKFRAMTGAGEFAEWAEVHGNLYGTANRVLADLRDRGMDVILDIDTQGAQQIRARHGSAVFIFIMPPSLEVLEERLRNRKSDHEDEIRKRMQRALEELRDFSLYQYLIVNKDFDAALAELQAIVLAERCRTRPEDAAWIERLLSNKP